MDHLNIGGRILSKNIIICCDGTSNKFGVKNTNVVKLYSCLPTGSTNQVSYYDPGVGTFSALPMKTRIGRFFSKGLGLAFGQGIVTNVKEAYIYLMKTYNPGDKIFLYGFSRGAYTVRVLAGFIHKCGILLNHNEQLVPYAFKLFETPKNNELASKFKSTFSFDANIHFLGIWDTVSSVGWVWNPKSWPYTRKNPSVSIIRHAVSIHEKRAFFRQNLVNEADENQDIKEVWFPGVHADVGGGYDSGKDDLSKIALEWMLVESQGAGLILMSTSKVSDIINYRVPLSKDNFKVNNSLNKAWILAEIWPKVAFNFKTKRKTLRINLARSRFIAENSVIHESVKKCPHLKSENLLDKPTIEKWTHFDPKMKPILTYRSKEKCH